MSYSCHLLQNPKYTQTHMLFIYHWRILCLGPLALYLFAWSTNYNLGSHLRNGPWWLTLYMERHRQQTWQLTVNPGSNSVTQPIYWRNLFCSLEDWVRALLLIYHTSKNRVEITQVLFLIWDPAAHYSSLAWNTVHWIRDLTENLSGTLHPILAVFGTLNHHDGVYDHSVYIIV